MCKNIVELDGPQMMRMRISGWIPKATDRHSEYVILIALPLQHWLHAVTHYTTLPTLINHKFFKII
jgi:hypothetical protein